MLELDVRTIQFISFAVNVSLAFFVWMQRRPPMPSVAIAVHYWSIGFATIGIGALLTALRGALPPWLSVIVGEAMAVGGFSLAIAGTRAFMSRDSMVWMFPLALLICALSSGYWSMIDPNPRLRIASLSVWGATQCVWMAVSLRFWLPTQQTGLRSRRGVAVVALLFGVFLSFYAYRIFTGDPLQTLPYQTDGDVVATVACAALLSIFFALWCLSILSGRLGRSLRQEVRRRDRMLTVLAHDLRSPFNVLLGGTEAMEMLARSGRTDKALAMATDVHAASKQAYALTDDLLIWVKSQFSGEALTAVDLGPAIRSAHNQLGQVFQTKQVGFEVNDHEDVRVQANKGGVEAILRNLLSNAVKFSRPGATVQIEVSRDAESARIVVSDQGVGISPHKLHMVMDPEQFHSTLGTDGEAGTGLGLSFCRDIAASFGGRLALESEQGKGTRAILHLPLAHRE